MVPKRTVSSTELSELCGPLGEKSVSFLFSGALGLHLCVKVTSPSLSQNDTFMALFCWLVLACQKHIF